MDYQDQVRSASYCSRVFCRAWTDSRPHFRRTAKKVIVSGIGAILAFAVKCYLFGMTTARTDLLDAGLAGLIGAIGPVILWIVCVLIWKLWMAPIELDKEHSAEIQTHLSAIANLTKQEDEPAAIEKEFEVDSLGCGSIVVRNRLARHSTFTVVLEQKTPTGGGHEFPRTLSVRGRPGQKSTDFGPNEHHRVDVFNWKRTSPKKLDVQTCEGNFITSFGGEEATFTICVICGECVRRPRSVFGVSLGNDGDLKTRLISQQ